MSGVDYDESCEFHVQSIIVFQRKFIMKKIEEILAVDEAYKENQLLCTILMFASAFERFNRTDNGTKVTFCCMIMMIIVLPYFIAVLAIDSWKKLKFYFLYGAQVSENVEASEKSAEW